jgi:hypothetical protein
MALKLFGHLGYADAVQPFGSPTVQAQFYETTQDLVAQYRADTDAQAGLLIQRDTENFQEWYTLYVHGGMLQALGGHDRPKGLKGYIRYTTGYPIEQFGEAIVDERVALAYMTVEQYDAHVFGMFRRHSARYRFEMARRLFRGTSESFTDPMFGATTVQSLANGDGAVYPLGNAGNDPITETHYLPTNFATITNVNNPYALIVAKWTAMFPEETVGGDSIIFINTNELAATQALATFYTITDPNLVQPITATRLTNEPTVPGSAKIVGRYVGANGGAWIATWNAAVDPGYMLSVHPNVPGPLVRRVDTAASGLPRGLHLEAEKGYDVNWPFRDQIFMDRFGFGVGNRLGAVVLQLVASTTYTPPTRYSI